MADAMIERRQPRCEVESIKLDDRELKMAQFPIGSNFEGDFVIQLVMVDDENTMDQVAEACAKYSVGSHVTAKPGRVMLVRRHSTGEVFPREVKLKDAGLMPTETVDIIYETV